MYYVPGAVLSSTQTLGHDSRMTAAHYYILQMKATASFPPYFLKLILEKENKGWGRQTEKEGERETERNINPLLCPPTHTFIG